MDFNVTIEDRAEVFKDDPRFASQQIPESEEQNKPDSPTQAKFGMKIKPLTDTDRESMDLKDNRGVEVVSVDQGSFAEDIGIVEKDVIVAINRTPITSVDDIRKIQSSLKAGDAVAFHIMRSNQIGARGGHSQWNSLWLPGTLPTE
jgi:serine protease Do